MSNNDKLIEAMAQEWPDTGELFSVEIFADWLIEKMKGYRLVSGWVPVSERLPEQGQYPVLVAHQSGAVRLVFGIEPFIEENWIGYYEPSLQGRFLRGFTHWMPLPAAPEVGRD